VLKEVQMAPGLLVGVVHPAALRGALRAGKRGAPLEVDPQLEAPLIGIEGARRYPPRSDQPQGLLKEIEIAHPAILPDPSRPRPPALPTEDSEEAICRVRRSSNILDADVLLATSKVRDWLTPRPTVKGIEKHHLFPRDYLKSVVGLKDNKKINQVANFALVEWSDNNTISNQRPSEYWPKEVADKGIEEARRVRQEEWHALPDCWTTLSYDQFLEQRRRLMANVIQEGFKRLTDPNYVPDLARPMIAPTSPVLGLPTFENLVTTGILPVGTLLTPVDTDRNTIAEVTEDGYIQVGEHLCETVERAAKEDDADVDSGWDYWQAHLDDQDDPITLAALREQAAAVAA